ncbi:MAG: large conductance mechanosensitive channel protein MscL [Firmicutes bacterium]|nr:large conductance mechanosensitive channel protein MscL [Bacillota bacterium]
MKTDIKKKTTGFFAEFKKFIMRGNVIDLAVGVIIGAAFQAIVNSLVNDIINPILGLFVGTDFSNLFIPLGSTDGLDPTKLNSLSYVRDEMGVAVFAYGSFITAIINFLILAFCIFLLVKGINALYELGTKKNAKEAAPAAPTVKKCPFCCSEIDIKATRCPHCTSELTE